MNDPVNDTDPSGHSVLLTLLIAGLIGATISGTFNAVGQAISRQPFDWSSFGLSLAGGFVAGAISAIPVGGAGFLSYLGTFALGGTGAVAGGLITGSVNSLETAGIAFAIGGFANIAARGVSEKLASVKASRIFNQGNKAKSLAVQQLQGHPLNMGAQALKGSMRNAFKQTTQQEVLRLLMNADPWIRFGMYTAISSSALSGWY